MIEASLFAGKPAPTGGAVYDTDTVGAGLPRMRSIQSIMTPTNINCAPI
jgi:hypothetical protein